jgi:putative ABC transport system ATP-binding protein
VFQQFFLLSGMSALDNVADGLLYSGIPRARRRERAAEALEQVGLGHRLHRNPEKLSGGERQRVAIARALVGNPAVVLADEPTGNLDSASSASIMGLLHELHASGATIVVITHDREIADSLPRQVAVRDGLIELDTGSGYADRTDNQRRNNGFVALTEEGTLR